MSWQGPRSQCSHLLLLQASMLWPRAPLSGWALCMRSPPFGWAFQGWPLHLIWRGGVCSCCLGWAPLSSGSLLRPDHPACVLPRGHIAALTRPVSGQSDAIRRRQLCREQVLLQQLAVFRVKGQPRGHRRLRTIAGVLADSRVSRPLPGGVTSDRRLPATALLWGLRGRPSVAALRLQPAP